MSPATGRAATHPARVVAAAFAAVIALGTALLALPAATPGEGRGSVLAALFTATSAVTTTGLGVVDTGSQWSPFGQAVILALMQVGGLGIMSAASVVTLVLHRRLGLRARITAQLESGTGELAGVGRVVVRIVVLTLVVEAVVALALAGRFRALGDDVGTAAWRGVFHAVSAFTNTGFALFSDSMASFALDEWVTVPLMVAVVVGGLGFPVVFEVLRELRTPSTWSLHSRLTLAATGVLVVVGTLVITALEWSNDATLGPLAVGDKLAVGLFQSVMPRSAGMQSIDYVDAHPATLLATDVLMFVGGGAASTAGGVRVVTVVLLGAVLLAEARGDPDVTAWGRRLPTGSVRAAVTVLTLALTTVVLGTGALSLLGSLDLGPALFEVTSALGTVGLSAGVTASLPASAQVLLVLLMFVGRLGPLTVAAVLLVREARVRYRLPEERVLIG